MHNSLELDFIWEISQTLSCNSNSSEIIEALRNIFNKYLLKYNSYNKRKNFKKSKSYQVTGINNFNYNWIHYLNILGIQYK